MLLQDGRNLALTGQARRDSQKCIGKDKATTVRMSKMIGNKLQGRLCMNMWAAKIWATALVLFSVLLSSSIVMAGQASSYTETNLLDGQCEQYAYNTAIAGGYTDVVVNSPSVTFNSGPFQCGARCVIKHNIVFIYCVGPSTEQAHDIAESMKKNGPWMQ